MRFKLVMPYIDRTAKRGSITKWHKAQGDRVGYGDDLLDMKIEEIEVLRRSTTPKSILANINPKDTYSCDRWEWFVRLTSSDMGVLRRIAVREGTLLEAGDLLAVLTTDDSESLEGTDEEWADASDFRVVVDTIESE